MIDERYARIRTAMCEEGTVDLDEQTRVVLETLDREKELRKPHVERIREYLEDTLRSVAP